MIQDEEIQRIKKNLPAYELKLFQTFLTKYHASQRENEQLKRDLKSTINSQKLWNNAGEHWHSEYQDTKQKLETKEHELAQILKERNHFDELSQNEIEDLKDKLNDHE